MTKSVSLVLLTVAGMIIGVQDAQARCCRSRCCAQNSCWSSPCASTCSTCSSCAATNDIAPAAPIVAANTVPGTGSNYQSFSYEPGTQPAATAPAVAAPMTPVYAPAPVAVQQPYSIYDSVLRGNRKVLGR